MDWAEPVPSVVRLIRFRRAGVPLADPAAERRAITVPTWTIDEDRHRQARLELRRYRRVAGGLLLPVILFPTDWPVSYNCPTSRRSTPRRSRRPRLIGPVGAVGVLRLKRDGLGLWTCRRGWCSAACSFTGGSCASGRRVFLDAAFVRRSAACAVGERDGFQTGPRAA